MKINYTWLQEYIVEKLPEPEALAEKIIFGAFEVEGIEIAPNGDPVLEIKTLPDRNHDCLGHYGMAKEIAGLLALTFKAAEFKTHESIPSDIKVSVQTDICNRYIARKILNLKVGDSPSWLSGRLESIGARSINNVVDATNYVMYTLGQPIHAFDYDKLGNGTLIIRQAQTGEEMLTLDGKLVPLDDTITVIANDTVDQPLAIAGVKGGKIAEVDTSTTTIVLEVANFNPVAVRKAANKANIHNDSSKRFENEITPFLADDAMRMVTDLIVSLAGGTPEIPVDEFPNVPESRTIEFTANKVNSLLGTTIDVSEMSAILKRYSYQFEESSGSFTLKVPQERIDITGAHDMAEEIGRVYGYNNIEAAIPSVGVRNESETPSEFETISAIKLDLVTKGYHEVMTYSFRKKGDFEVARGPVGKSALRKNIVDGLTEAFALNTQNASLLGADTVRIFEIGSVFKSDGEQIMVAIADSAGVREMALREYPTPAKGTVHLEPSGQTTFKPWSEYPFMTRDIAVWMPEGESSSTLVDIVKSLGTELLQGEPRLFDTFSKDGRTSYGYRMVFQSYERTLTDAEITVIMDTIYANVKERGWEVR